MWKTLNSRDVRPNYPVRFEPESSSKSLKTGGYDKSALNDFLLLCCSTPEPQSAPA